MVWGEGQEQWENLPLGRAHIKGGGEGEEDVFSLALKTIIRLCAFDCFHARWVEKRLVFDNFISNASL